jgi:hypothetical protein
MNGPGSDFKENPTGVSFGMSFPSHRMETRADPVVHDAIARRAYELWEREGRIHGHHERHWLEAKRLLHDTMAKDNPLHFPPHEAGHPPHRPS